MSTSKMAIPQGWQLLPIVETIPSTNTWLKEHAEHLQDKTILIAREQTQGRGRSDRSFHSARDRGLYLSVLLKETISDLPLTKLTALCALAAHRAIKESCQLTTQIKWVNDILCQEYKLAGILCEALYEGTRPKAFVIGFGINVFSQEFPPMDNQPGAIADFSPITPSMSAMTFALLRHLDLCLQHIDDPKEMAEYRMASCVLHHTVQIQEGNRSYPADVIGIDDDGALQIRVGTEVRTLRSAEIHIRPANDVPSKTNRNAR